MRGLKKDSWKPEEARALERPIATGALDEVHTLYCSWFSKQQPEPRSGAIDKDCFYFAAYQAATTNRPIPLAYLLSQGVRFDGNLVKGAVLSKSTDVLQVLLDNGWNINEPESFSDPPFLGLIVSDESLVRWFVAHGANPNASAGEWDVTPLSCAAMKAPISIIKLLFQNGGSAAYGQLLNFACYRTDPDCVPIIEFLLSQGAPLNNTLWENQPHLTNWAAVGATTPLFNAAEAGNKDAVQYLLTRGADRTKKSIRTGKSPLDIAMSCNYTEIVNLLKQTNTGSLQTGC